MNILCFDSPFAAELTAQGHTVTAIHGQEDNASLLHIIEEHHCTPDLIIQHESLGRRFLLQDLEKAPCPTLFVAVDAHLNLYWQRYYARLFDAVLTPHLSLYTALPAEWKHPKVLRFNHLGYNRPWKPFAERPHDLALCARITAHRPVRIWMAALLQQRCGMELHDNLPFDDMMRLYGDTCYIPNEAIANEVNFRLFEGASSGSVVFSPDVGEDQNSQFLPGKEFLVYRDGLELLEQIRWCRKNRNAAEAMGHAAYTRVQAEHLPRHRATQLIRIAHSMTQKRATGEEAQRLYWLSSLHLTRQGHITRAVPSLLTRGKSLEQTPEVLAGLLHLYVEPGNKQEALTLCRQLLSTPHVRTLDCASAASAAALLCGDPILARRFLLLYIQGNAITIDHLPETPYQICIAWADLLRKAEREFQTGFVLTQGKTYLPQCAYDFLRLADTIEPNQLETVHKNNILCTTNSTLIAWRLQLLAELCLHDQNNWRLQLEYGLLSLVACRVDEGMFEIREAQVKAKAAGKEAAFSRVLAGMPTGAYIERELLLSTAYTKTPNKAAQ